MTATLPRLQSTRNIRLGFSLTILILFIFVLAFSWVSWKTEKQDETNELSLLAELSGQSINSYFAHYEYALNALNQDVHDANGMQNLKKLNFLLKRFKDSNPNIANSNFIDLHGQIIASTTVLPIAGLPNISQQSSFITSRNELLNGKIFTIGRPTFGSLIKDWLIPLRYGVRDPQGKLIYILSANLLISKQQEFWQSAYLPQNARIGLLRDDQFLLSTFPTPQKADIEETYGKIRTGGLAFFLQKQNYPKRGFVEGYNSVARENYNFAFYRLKNYPLTFFISTPVANLQAKWWKHNQPFYLLIIIISLNIFGVYYWTVKRQEKREIEGQLQEARLQLAAKVFTHAREGIMITDDAGTIIEVNDTFTHITGYDREEVLGKNPRIFNSGHQTPEFYSAMWKALTEGGNWAGELWNLRKNGDKYAGLISISAVRNSENKTTNYVSIYTDITPMKEHQQQLEHIAHYDVLTSLPNRVLLADRLQQAIALSQRRNQSLAVAYLDLDEFKAVNDIHGHDVGDQLLEVVAQRMNTALRDGDTLARIGGDEFVAVLVDLELPQDYESILTRLLQAASDPVTIGDVVLQVSVSIGVTIYPQDGADVDHLMRHADQAMYQAKQAGKNRYHLFDVSHDTALQTQRESLEHIRRGIDRHEFLLYYQPKVNMKTGEVIGAEALIRWLQPERGLMPPSAFLPIIENHPISLELGEWVIDTALAQMAEWHAAGLEIPVSVNVTAHQLQQGDFVARLSSLLEAHPEVLHSFLELEVLETSAFEDVVQVSKIMHACREMGVRFAMDDFGTGYSSLTYLKLLPANVLKIDQSFVRDMLDNQDDLAIVKGIIGLATAFHRMVIAEGVESVAHGTLLLSLGCELAQGYAIARPMPASELSNWVATWRPDAAWKLLPCNK
jgi:diguanylate cyclase (GGDEF)-like protein/PAS domain S-box-containing protein